MLRPIVLAASLLAVSWATVKSPCSTASATVYPASSSCRPPANVSYDFAKSESQLLLELAELIRQPKSQDRTVAGLQFFIQILKKCRALEELAGTIGVVQGYRPPTEEDLENVNGRLEVTSEGSASVVTTASGGISPRPKKLDLDETTYEYDTKNFTATADARKMVLEAVTLSLQGIILIANGSVEDSQSADARLSDAERGEQSLADAAKKLLEKSPLLSKNGQPAFGVDLGYAHADASTKKMLCLLILVSNRSGGGSFVRLRSFYKLDVVLLLAGPSSGAHSIREHDTRTSSHSPLFCLHKSSPRQPPRPPRPSD